MKRKNKLYKKQNETGKFGLRQYLMYKRLLILMILFIINACNSGQDSYKKCFIDIEEIGLNEIADIYMWANEEDVKEQITLSILNSFEYIINNNLSNDLRIFDIAELRAEAIFTIIGFYKAYKIKFDKDLTLSEVLENISSDEDIIEEGNILELVTKMKKFVKKPKNNINYLKNETSYNKFIQICNHPEAYSSGFWDFKIMDSDITYKEIIEAFNYNYYGAQKALAIMFLECLILRDGGPFLSQDYLGWSNTDKSNILLHLVIDHKWSSFYYKAEMHSYWAILNNIEINSYYFDNEIEALCKKVDSIENYRLLR